MCCPSESSSKSNLGKFRSFAQKVISVPKSEIDRREKEYKTARKVRAKCHKSRLTPLTTPLRSKDRSRCPACRLASGIPAVCR
jgi:hypothetical protein